jgi:Tfp pilus assembly PilM family ATPase
LKNGQSQKRRCHDALMPNLISKVISPWYPATAIGLDKGSVSVVHLERARGNACTIRRAATFTIADPLIQPGFEQPNIEDPAQLAAALSELATSAGLLRQKRWSVTLPEASTRTLVLSLESPIAGSELQDVLKWKMERGFGFPVEELSISREHLQRDAQGRDRYVVIGIRKSVLAEYEGVLASLGWRIGLLLPRHLGEAQWLIRNGHRGDALLLSASKEGFTAVIFRDKHPLIVRSVNCTEEEYEDELYRLLLFYRDRRVADGQDPSTQLSRMMVVGEGVTKQRAREIVNETIGGDLRPLEAQDFGLQIPGRELSFDAIAAPAGLASLSL